MPSAPPEGLLPLVEANQGLISIAALVLALVFALLEQRRATNATRDRREEFRNALVALCDEIAGDLPQWPNGAALAAAPAVIAALLRSPPPAAGLIVEAVAFEEASKIWARNLNLGMAGMGDALKPEATAVAEWRKRMLAA